MIMRVYRCKLLQGREAEFRQYAMTSSHPWLKAQKGLVAFYAGKSVAGEPTRCMTLIWESEAALEAAVGPHWRSQPTLDEVTSRFLESASIEHYELADWFRSGVEPQSAGLPN